MRYDEWIAVVMRQMNEWELRTVGHVPIPEPLEPAMAHGLHPSQME